MITTFLPLNCSIGHPLPYAPRINNWSPSSSLKNSSVTFPTARIVKGIPYESGKKVNMTYDKKQDCYGIIPYEEVPSSYPGTGDCFASRLIGELLKGESLANAAQKATSFVTYGVKVTYEAHTDTKEGILLERLLSF